MPVQTGSIEANASAKKQSELEVSQLDQLTENAVAGISRLDVDGRYESVDNGYAATVGRTPEEMIGMSWEETVHPDDLDSVRITFQKMVQSGRGDVVVRGMRKGGAVFYKQITLIAIRGDDGFNRGSHCFMRDVSDRKRIEQEVRQLGQAMENAFDGIARLDAKGCYVEVNTALAKIFRVTPAELVGLSWEEGVHPEDLAKAKKAYAQMLKGGRCEIELRAIRRDGIVIHNDVTLVAIHGDNGDILGSLCFKKDVSDRRRAEEALLLANRELVCQQFAIDEHAIVAVTNKDGRVAYANDRFCAISKYSREELIGQDHAILNSGLHSKEFFEEMYETITKGNVWRGEMRNRAKDGSFYWTNATIVPQTNHQTDDVERYIGISTDITAMRFAQETVESARFLAEDASQAKGQFLANMSHEIRTPMSAILGYADLMLDPNQSQSKNLNGLQAIRRNGEHLLELINNVLDLSKIEARHMTTERIPTQFPRLIAEAISMTRPRAIGKDLSLQLEFTTPVPREIRTDPLRLRQALVNLIGNAVKFTEAGTIVVKVSCTRSLDTHTEIRIDVVDTGVGISRDKQDKLFQPFSQSDLTTTRRFGGTGLGLTLSQSFIQLLGGDITFESEEGRGSIFSIHLPVGPINAEELVDGSKEAVKGEESLPKLNFPNASLAGCRVLLAEDGVDNREILAAFVRGAGAIVDVAVNGREAVAMALNSKLAGNQHDLILMDMQMPELDGYGATSELRRRGYTGPIVALTAHAMSTDRDKCLISGCNDYMSKPVQRQALLGLVSKFFTRKEQAISPPLAEAIAPAKTLRSPLADEPQFAGVLAGFVSRLPLTVAELRHCMESNTLPELSRAAHKLRGAGGSYELQELTDAASVVEDDLAAGATLAAIRPQCDALIATIRRIEGYDPNAESAKKAA